MSLLRALNSELLKLKRTLAFRVIFVLPFFVALLQFFVIYRTKKFAPGFDLWQMHPTNSFQIWAIFMMPLLITLETALLNGIEHSDKQWKHLFTLPVPRGSIYLSKFIVALGLILVSTLVLALLTVLVGVLAVSLKPELASITGPVPYLTIAKQATQVWLAGWLITAIHTWISIRWAGLRHRPRRGHRRHLLRPLRRQRLPRQILPLAPPHEPLPRRPLHHRAGSRDQWRNRRRLFRLQ